MLRVVIRLSVLLFLSLITMGKGCWDASEQVAAPTHQPVQLPVPAPTPQAPSPKDLPQPPETKFPPEAKKDVQEEVEDDDGLIGDVSTVEPQFSLSNATMPHWNSPGIRPTADFRGPLTWLGLDTKTDIATQETFPDVSVVGDMVSWVKDIPVYAWIGVSSLAGWGIVKAIAGFFTAAVQTTGGVITGSGGGTNEGYHQTDGSNNAGDARPNSDAFRKHGDSILASMGPLLSSGSTVGVMVSPEMKKKQNGSTTSVDVAAEQSDSESDKEDTPTAPPMPFASIQMHIGATGGPLCTTFPKPSDSKEKKQRRTSTASLNTSTGSASPNMSADTSGSSDQTLSSMLAGSPNPSEPLSILQQLADVSTDISVTGDEQQVPRLMVLPSTPGRRTDVAPPLTGRRIVSQRLQVLSERPAATPIGKRPSSMTATEGGTPASLPGTVRNALFATPSQRILSPATPARSVPSSSRSPQRPVLSPAREAIVVESAQPSVEEQQYLEEVSLIFTERTRLAKAKKVEEQQAQERKQKKATRKKRRKQQARTMHAQIEKSKERMQQPSHQSPASTGNDMYRNQFALLAHIPSAPPNITPPRRMPARAVVTTTAPAPARRPNWRDSMWTNEQILTRAPVVVGNGERSNRHLYDTFRNVVLSELRNEIPLNFDLDTVHALYVEAVRVHFESTQGRYRGSPLNRNQLNDLIPLIVQEEIRKQIATGEFVLYDGNANERYVQILIDMMNGGSFDNVTSLELRAGMSQDIRIRPATYKGLIEAIRNLKKLHRLDVRSFPLISWLDENNVQVDIIHMLLSGLKNLEEFAAYINEPQAMQLFYWRNEIARNLRMNLSGEGALTYNSIIHAHIEGRPVEHEAQTYEQLPQTPMAPNVLNASVSLSPMLVYETVQSADHGVQTDALSPQTPATPNVSMVSVALSPMEFADAMQEQVVLVEADAQTSFMDAMYLVHEQSPSTNTAQASPRQLTKWLGSYDLNNGVRPPLSSLRIAQSTSPRSDVVTSMGTPFGEGLQDSGPLTIGRFKATPRSKNRVQNVELEFPDGITELSDDDVRALIQFLESDEGRGLRRIDLSGRLIYASFEAIHNLFEAISELPDIEIIILNDNNLNNDEDVFGNWIAGPLLRIMAGQNITTVELAGNNLNGNNFARLVVTMQSMLDTRIQRLNLSRNGFGDEGTGYLVQYFGESAEDVSETYTELEIGDNDISPTGMDWFAEHASRLNGLVSLNVANNSVVDPDLEETVGQALSGSLAGLVNIGAPLARLNLASTGIDSEVLGRLSPHFAQFALTHLDLSNSELGEAVARSFLDYATGNETLEVLVLRGTQMTPEALDEVLAVFEEGNQLRRLYIDRMAVDDFIKERIAVMQGWNPELVVHISEESSSLRQPTEQQLSSSNAARVLNFEESQINPATHSYLPEQNSFGGEDSFERLERELMEAEKNDANSVLRSPAAGKSPTWYSPAGLRQAAKRLVQSAGQAFGLTPSKHAKRRHSVSNTELVTAHLEVPSSVHSEVPSAITSDPRVVDGVLSIGDPLTEEDLRFLEGLRAALGSDSDSDSNPIHTVNLAGALVEADAGTIARTLAAVLRMPNVVDLNLADNNLGSRAPEILEQVVAGLKEIKRLQRLELGNNQLGDEGYLILASALRKLKNLRSLGLGNNAIGDQQRDNIATLITNRLTKLLECRLEGNDWSVEAVGEIDEILKEHRKKQEMDDGFRARQDSLTPPRAVNFNASPTPTTRRLTLSEVFLLASARKLAAEKADQVQVFLSQTGDDGFVPLFDDIPDPKMVLQLERNTKIPAPRKGSKVAGDENVGYRRKPGDENSRIPVLRPRQGSNQPNARPEVKRWIRPKVVRGDEEVKATTWQGILRRPNAVLVPNGIPLL